MTNGNQELLEVNGWTNISAKVPKKIWNPIQAVIYEVAKKHDLPSKSYKKIFWMYLSTIKPEQLKKTLEEQINPNVKKGIFPFKK